MYDFHIHSHFSGDSSSSMEEMMLAGKILGLSGICFTDHVDLDYPSSQISFEFSYDDYINDLNSIRASFHDDFKIFTGVEIGMQPHICAENEALLKDKSFDFIIGSIHCVNKKDLYDGSYLEGITHNQGIINYFQDMLQCLDNFSDFDVLGHLDGIRRYLYGNKGSFSYDVYKGYIHDVLSKLVNSHKGIEINTSGLRYGLSSFHPMPEILELYRSLGGKIITIGSDSHKPDTLGYEFNRALNLLSDIGFKYYTIYKDRKPLFIKI
ncbi:MAG: histidinol-phosphatase HisJ family protein [Clostridiaceae bacterium]|nr:histidinol-phosphatase HisJ family protein [Clostridiaceae bacterium]